MDRTLVFDAIMAAIKKDEAEVKRIIEEAKNVYEKDEYSMLVDMMLNFPFTATDCTDVIAQLLSTVSFMKFSAKIARKAVETFDPLLLANMLSTLEGVQTIDYTQNSGVEPSPDFVKKIEGLFYE